MQLKKKGSVQVMLNRIYTTQTASSLLSDRFQGSIGTMPVIIWSDEIHLLMPITQAYPTLVVLGGLVLSVSVLNINMVCLSKKKSKLYY